MGKVIDLSNKLKQLTVSMLEAETLKSMKRHEEIAVNMNTDQLFQGQDAKGKDLPKYSDNSVAVFGKPAGPMRLFDSGDFYRGFFLNTSKFPVMIFSHDQKTGKIADLLASKGHNPDDIYGLQKHNLTDFARSYVLEDLQNFFRNFIRV
jgi:hypothetical protein